MNKYIDINMIDFIKKEDIIEEVPDGHSGSLLYKIIRGKNKFFLKIFNEIFEEEKIKRVKEYLEIYKNLNIKSLNIVDYGNIKKLNKYYIVYNFIEGVNLSVYTDSDEYSLKDIRRIGKFIGKEMLKLKMYENYDRNLILHNSIDSAQEEVVNNFYFMLKDKFTYNMITKYFKMDEINKFRDKLKEYSSFVKSEQPKLIHGDIKRANIMIDNMKNLYIIDVESMQISYDIMNFLYQMTWSLFDQKEAEFVSGYFDGIYNGSRPNNFNYNIIFIIIVNFFEASYTMYKKSQNDKLNIYLQNCRNLFDKINQLNLKKEFII